MFVRFALLFGLLFSLPCFSQAVTPPTTARVASLVAILQRAADVHPDATLNKREEDGAIATLRLNAAEAAAFSSVARVFNGKIKQWRQSELAVLARAGKNLGDAHRAELALIVKERDQIAKGLAAQFLAAASRETRANLRRISDEK